MVSNLISLSTGVIPEYELTFPNLFGGFTLSYFPGFEIFGVYIYWYGIIITIGVILAYFYANARAMSFGVNKDRMFDVVFVAIICGFLGARIYYCVFQTLDPNGIDYTFVTTFTTIREGGLAIYGGIIGAFVSGFIVCKIRKVNFLAMADIASLGFLIGQTIGRWGNCINQEAFGRQCSDNWLFGMTSVDIIYRDYLEAGSLVHPCFLYESVWCLVGFIALHFYSKKLRSFDGEIFLMYLAWYGLGRTWIEGLRTDSLMAGSFKISQLVAAACFIVCTILVVVFKIITEKKGIPLYVNTDEFREIEQAYQAELAELKLYKQYKKDKKNAKAPSILGDDVDMEDIPQLSKEDYERGLARLNAMLDREFANKSEKTSDSTEESAPEAVQENTEETASDAADVSAEPAVADDEPKNTQNDESEE